mgnify:CR=1 FL=1
MFSKLKTTSSSSSSLLNPASPTLSISSNCSSSGNSQYNIDVNPIAQYFECGKQIGSAGPELAWKIFDAVRKSDSKVNFSKLQNYK